MGKAESMGVTITARYDEHADRWFRLRGAGAAPAFDEFPGPLLLDPVVAGWRGTPAQLRKEAPETILGFPARGPLLAAADLLERVDPQADRAAAADRRASVDLIVRDVVEPWLAGPAPDCMAFVADMFGLEVPDATVIDVRLVDDGVPFAGVTNLTLDQEIVAFVAVAGWPRSTLLELIVHEVTHALVEIAGGGPLQALARSARGEPGQLWHVPFFLTAAEAVRRFVHPGHQDYGDEYGYYAKVPAAMAFVEGPWRDRLTGATTAEEAIARILA